MHRTEGDIHRRSRVAAVLFGGVLLAGFSLAGVWLQWIPGYAISSVIGPAALPDPLAKQVVRSAGAWMHNYQNHPATIAVSVLAYLGITTALGRA